MTTTKTTKTLSDKHFPDFKALTTKSSRIRYLNSIGWTRSEIAVYLNIRYQHVRNVLITPTKTS